MSKTKDSLPENAFRPLNEGEEYVPLMEAGTNPKEVTVWSVVWGSYLQCRRSLSGTEGGTGF